MDTHKVDIDLDEKEVVITEDSFDEYFFDARKHAPKPGQVLACYTTVAYFGKGFEKEQLVHLLKSTDKAEAASQVMKKLLLAKEPCCWTVPKEIITDLMNGMTDEEVIEKEYKYIMEAYYYTSPENVPEDDPHWSYVSILNLDQICDKLNKS